MKRTYNDNYRMCVYRKSFYKLRRNLNRNEYDLLLCRGRESPFAKICLKSIVENIFHPYKCIQKHGVENG